MNIFNTLLYQPILQALMFINGLVNNLGISIILLTLVIRLILLPLTLPAIKAQAKIKELQPEINKLKEKFKDDKNAFQQAQVQLFQQHKVNPAAGCLPYLLQFAVLIALYRVFMDFLNQNPETTQFLWFNLQKPDPYFILPLLAGLTQFILALMLYPAADASAEKALATATPTKKDDKKADTMQDMANAMQQQMLIFMPAMTAFFAWRFPSGLAVYWVITTIFSAIQQYYITGLGGLANIPATLKRAFSQK